jgi:hypothetical protein
MAAIADDMLKARRATAGVSPVPPRRASGKHRLPGGYCAAPSAI